MIARPVSTPVFHYYFRPLSKEYMHDPHDFGFSLTLYHDNLLLIEHYGPYCQIRYQELYSMPLQLKMDFLALLDKYAPVLRSVEANLMLPQDQAPRFASRFGFDQMGLICCADIFHLMQKDFLNEKGHQARLLYAFFEEVAMIFAPYGVHMRIYDYTLRGELSRLHQTAPFNPHQPTSSYSNGYVQTSAQHTSGYNTEAYNTGAYNTGAYNTGAYNTGTHRTRAANY